tara:strand:- start:2324 stop:2521 length:198 start_codon:yes stop_codon:yes gene_type:complete
VEKGQIPPGLISFYLFGRALSWKYAINIHLKILLRRHACMVSMTIELVSLKDLKALELIQKLMEH